MRGERKGHRETERMERLRGGKQTWRMRRCRRRRIVHDPKLFFYSLLKQLKSENNQCVCNTAMNIIIINTPREPHVHRSFLALWTGNPSHLQAQKQKKWRESEEHVSRPCSEQLGFMLLRAEESYQKAHREMQPMNSVLTRYAGSDSIQ